MKKRSLPAVSIGSIALLALLVLLLTACRDTPKHYFLQGRVLGKSDSTQQLTINHGNIPGFMAAMTMPYPVKDAQGFQEVRPGDLIAADVIVDVNNDYWLEHLTIKDKSGRGSISSLPPHQLLPGVRVPDVPLTNQDGKALHLTEFKGKAVLITFIYTRCPFPTFCPLISSEFAAIHKELAKTPVDYGKTQLISISLDPQYDTPTIMRTLGFCFDSPADLRKLATAFGLQYFEQDNQISHSMETILLSTDGTVSQSWPGNEWKPSEVIAALRQAAAVKL